MNEQEIKKLKSELEQARRERDEFRDELANEKKAWMDSTRRYEAAAKDAIAEASRLWFYEGGFNEKLIELSLCQQERDILRADNERLKAECARLGEVLEVAYDHMDTFGVVSGGKPEEVESQERFFDLYHEVRFAPKAGDDNDTRPLTPEENVLIEKGWQKLKAAEQQERKGSEARKCDRPPAGWMCTRGCGHSGPCAAIEAALAPTDAAKGEAPTYTEEELKKWWIAVCPECKWSGLSRDCGGGGQIADTGDYDDPVCPECSKRDKWVPVDAEDEQQNGGK